MSQATVPVEPRGTLVRVAVVDDHALVQEGVAGLLRPFRDRLCLVEHAIGSTAAEPVDIALYDPFSPDGGHRGSLDRLVTDPHVGTVAIYTWNLTTQVVGLRRHRGVGGVLSKTLSPHDLMQAVLAIHGGHQVVSPDPGVFSVRGTEGAGQANVLTSREAEIVALITAGLTNQEIATLTHLSINSVKSYIRGAYRAMGVTTRSQAILWGLDNGLRHQNTGLPPVTPSTVPDT